MPSSRFRDCATTRAWWAGRGESGAGFEAFVGRRGALAGLGDLPEGGSSSEAFGVSADGRVAVGRSNAAEGSQAVLWSELGP